MLMTNEQLLFELDTLKEELKHHKDISSFYITTFGCQMNAHDSEKLVGLLEYLGLTNAPSEEEASIVVYNTCCVRENAENRVYGHLGYLKHIKETSNPNMLICLCGCMMQQAHVLETIQEKHRHVDIIFGTHNVSSFPSMIRTRLDTKKMVIDIWEKHRGIDEITESLPSTREYPFKSGVNITYGCDNFCTYCVVPFVRGRERSRASNDIIKEIETLVKDGVVEIMLLGQNVNSYGKGLEEDILFASLLKKIAKIEGLKRIRFMTSHPKDLSDDLIDVMATHDNICKTIHLPIQSGSSRILEKMNRKYTKEAYLLLVDKLRAAMPGIPITTDIIIGFPTETEEDFLETLDVVNKVGFSSAFTFYYSKRVGTPAAAMKEQVPKEVAKDRFDRLLAALDKNILQQNKEKIGTTVPVLVEEINESAPNMVTGRSDVGDIVHLVGKKEDIGKIIPVQITDCQTYYLVGRPL